MNKNLTYLSKQNIFSIFVDNKISIAVALMKYFLPAIVILFFLTGCKENIFFSDKISEGQISYDITYLETEKQNPLIALLPTSMSFKFKDDNSAQKIEGWMGIFSMAGIHNVKTNTHSALLKIMNDKLCFQTKELNEPFGFDEMSGMKIEYLDSTKVIAGYECKKAMVSFPGTDEESFDIYYFDKIDLKEPNCHNPFNKVPGVIMEYRISFQKIGMILNATKVEKMEIDDKEFEVPEGYKTVTRDEIDEKIKSLM